MEHELREALSKRVRTYLESHPRATLRSLAKRSGLSTMTVSRLVQGEVLKPSFEAAVALIGVVAKGDEVSDFLKLYFPETMQSVSKVYSENAGLLNHEDIEQVLTDPLTFTIFDLASMDAGITRSTIRAEFGNQGQKALDSLLLSGLLYEDSSGNVTFKNGLNHVAVCPQDVIARLKIRLEQFQFVNLGTKAARLAQISESLNLEGMEKIHEVLTECIEKIQDIRQDSSYKGKIPVYIGLFMNLVSGTLADLTVQQKEVK